MLTGESANTGLNFLTPGIIALAKQRIAEGPGAEPFRLLRNMLSSQPMCFNLFGELALDLDNAAELVQALWGTSAGSSAPFGGMNGLKQLDGLSPQSPNQKSIGHPFHRLSHYLFAYLVQHARSGFRQHCGSPLFGNFLQ